MKTEHELKPVKHAFGVIKYGICTFLQITWLPSCSLVCSVGYIRILMCQMSLDSSPTLCTCLAVFAHSTSCAVGPRETRVPRVARALCHAVAAL